jgi:hypothetical protein
MDAFETPPSEQIALPRYLPQSGWMRALVSLFIVFHLGGILLWNLPSTYTLSEIRSRMYRYMNFMGLTQGWAMFAPDPGHENYYFAARITFADGKKRLWYIGRQDNLNQFDRLLNERIRKFSENLFTAGNAVMYYPQVAHWAAWSNRSRTNPPVKVELIRYTQPIPYPSPQLDTPLPTEWNSQVVYTTTMQGGKLP